MNDGHPTDGGGFLATAVGTPRAADSAPASASVCSRRTCRVIVGLAALAGALGAWFCSRDWGLAAGERWGLAAIAMLIGLVIGLQIVRLRDPQARRRDPAVFLTHPGWMLALSASASAVVAVLLGLLLISGEGVSLVLILVLPLTALCWLVGGRMVSATARRALQEIGAGRRPETERPSLELALRLSRLLGIAFLGLLLWLLLAIFG